MDRIEELEKEIRSSIGFRAQSELESLSIRFYAFDSNYQQWKKYLSLLKQPENLLNLWDQKNHTKFIIALSEITRLLLNFLASATSLISVTRNSIPVWYHGTEFAQEYKVKKDKLANDIECKFIEDLRNYSQHYQLPFATAEIQLNPENGPTGRFLLNGDMLRAWDGWAKGKAFLSTIEQNVDLEILIDHYYNKIFSFHEWIFTRIKEINSEEIQITSEKQEELRRLLKEIFESD